MPIPYWVAKINECEVGISPCPAGGKALKGELKILVEKEELCLVSLLTEKEERRLGLRSEKALCEELGIRCIKFPIVDMYVPPYKMYVAFIEHLYSISEEANRILIHCHAGIGRSSLIALGLMTRHGMPLEQSIQHVSRIRRFHVPQSISQKRLLVKYAAKQEKKGGIWI